MTRACDYCHRRSVRCHPGGKCRNCLDFGLDCLYQREVKKRGAPARGKDGEDTVAGVSPNDDHCPLSNGSSRSGNAYLYGFQAAEHHRDDRTPEHGPLPVNEDTSTLDQCCVSANKIIDKFKIIPQGLPNSHQRPAAAPPRGDRRRAWPVEPAIMRNTDFQEGIAQYANVSSVLRCHAGLLENLESVLKGRRLTERLEEQAPGIEEHIRVMQRRQEQK
ncbi:Transcriptional activator protein-like protein [Emericellopsis cladophorae]|uniref:Transcriptional activator protein-like protein n=1 Tax=Emericellopsis cladophorae TaxID=2686198 RepID=A0A9P9XW28_9HYPO|nr:Transcriptional activator protein-like protein [Emericellopsis cladophorae]KAI6778500.1 Transcriptional activator protein-like protein [Emericellopsis cladophorae]